MKTQLLANQINIGSTIAKRLADIGLVTVQDLRSAGVVRTYKYLEEQSDTRLPVCYYLYGLEGALRGCHWDKLPNSVKDQLHTETKGKPRTQNQGYKS